MSAEKTLLEAFLAVARTELISVNLTKAVIDNQGNNFYRSSIDTPIRVSSRG